MTVMSSEPRLIAPAPASASSGCGEKTGVVDVVQRQLGRDGEGVGHFEVERVERGGAVRLVPAGVDVHGDVDPLHLPRHQREGGVGRVDGGGRAGHAQRRGEARRQCVGLAGPGDGELVDRHRPAAAGRRLGVVELDRAHHVEQRRRPGDERVRVDRQSCRHFHHGAGPQSADQQPFDAERLAVRLRALQPFQRQLLEAAGIERARLQRGEGGLAAVRLGAFHAVEADGGDVEPVIEAGHGAHHVGGLLRRGILAARRQLLHVPAHLQQFLGRDDRGADGDVAHRQRAPALAQAGIGRDLVAVDRDRAVDRAELVRRLPALGIEHQQHGADIYALGADAAERALARILRRTAEGEARGLHAGGGEATFRQPLQADGAVDHIRLDARIAGPGTGGDGGFGNDDPVGGDLLEEAERHLPGGAPARRLCRHLQRGDVEARRAVAGLDRRGERQRAVEGDALDRHVLGEDAVGRGALHPGGEEGGDLQRSLARRGDGEVVHLEAPLEHVVIHLAGLGFHAVRPEVGERRLDMAACEMADDEVEGEIAADTGDQESDESNDECLAHTGPT